MAKRAKKLSIDFYAGEDVVSLSRMLLGKILVTHFEGEERTAGRIVETEAYAGAEDRASHSYGGRRTDRTESMYLPGGHSYVYLCYGIHKLFRVLPRLAHRNMRKLLEDNEKQLYKRNAHF